MSRSFMKVSRAPALLDARLKSPWIACAFGMGLLGLLAACGGDAASSTEQGDEVLGCNGTVAFAEAEGTFDSGTPWNMRRPAEWNGVLINDLDYVGAKDGERSCFWLTKGYALSGTARNPQRTYNYDPANEQDELMQLIDMFTEQYGEPKTVVQYGHSGGGFDALNIAERFEDYVDGVVAGCAHEQVPLMNMMMDGWFVLKTLIAPELRIVGFNDLDTVSEQSAKWKEALIAAQETSEGRARITLAAAIGQWPAWSTTTVPKPEPGDKTALQKAIFETVLLNADQPGGQSRFMSEHAGGSPTPRQLSWNTGINYAQFLSSAEPTLGSLVQWLYTEAALDLKEDLDKLANAERIQADPDAIAFWATPGRTVHGTPKVPVLRFHTTGDSIVPPNIMDSYVQKIDANSGNAELYQTVVVDRPGHCTFDPAESAAAVEALLSRINTGSWPDLSPAAMNIQAKELLPTSTPLFVPFESARANRPYNASPDVM